MATDDVRDRLIEAQDRLIRLLTMTRPDRRQIELADRDIDALRAALSASPAPSTGGKLAPDVRTALVETIRNERRRLSGRPNASERLAEAIEHRLAPLLASPAPVGDGGDPLDMIAAALCAWDGEVEWETAGDDDRAHYRAGARASLAAYRPGREREWRIWWGDGTYGTVFDVELERRRAREMGVEIVSVEFREVGPWQDVTDEGDGERTHHVETYKPVPRPAGEHERLVRESVERAPHDTASRAFRPAEGDGDA